MADILTVNHLQKNFGQLKAVDDLSFEVRDGEILGMMGPNGAGKTTVFNLLTGVVKPDNGTIVFKGKDVTHASPAKRCHLGIGRTYQVPCPFEKMTVFENLLVGAVHGGRLSEKRARRSTCYPRIDRDDSHEKPCVRGTIFVEPEEIGDR